MFTTVILYVIALVFVVRVVFFLWDETVKRWEAWKLSQDDDYWKETEGEWQDMEQPFGSTGEEKK